MRERGRERKKRERTAFYPCMSFPLQDIDVTEADSLREVTLVSNHEFDYIQDLKEKSLQIASV